jgi:hypothetical protein
MNTPNVPGFTAEASLDATSEDYRIGAAPIPERNIVIPQRRSRFVIYCTPDGTACCICFPDHCYCGQTTQV